MVGHREGRRSPVEWLRGDLRGAIGLGRLVKIIRLEPMLLFWMLVYVGVGVLMAEIVLLVVGRFDLFMYAALFGVTVGTGFMTPRIERALAKHPSLHR